MADVEKLEGIMERVLRGLGEYEEVSEAGDVKLGVIPVYDERRACPPASAVGGRGTALQPSQRGPTKRVASHGMASWSMPVGANRISLRGDRHRASDGEP